MHRWLQREFEWLSVFLVSGCALQTDPQGFTHMQFAEAHEFMLSASAWRDKKTNLNIFTSFIFLCITDILLSQYCVL